jgi:uncharacterized protein YceK
MKILIVVFAVAFVLVLGCGSSVNSTKTGKQCTGNTYKDAVIRWGGHNMLTNQLAGWQINAKGKLMQFKKAGRESDYEFTEFSTIDSNRFCKLLDTVQKYFLEIQALNAPGDSSHFVQFINSTTSTDIRAVWNMRYQTYGSREFRSLYDTLEAIADREYKIYLKKGDNPANSVK